ncbi:hypothetical protein TRVL_02640 [Trypanosoma vivax]|nr:hypothetical protein TRVL_02640 [Trypanosoma vivax]
MDSPATFSSVCPASPRRQAVAVSLVAGGARPALCGPQLKGTGVSLSGWKARVYVFSPRSRHCARGSACLRVCAVKCRSHHPRADNRTEEVSDQHCTRAARNGLWQRGVHCFRRPTQPCRRGQKL